MEVTRRQFLGLSATSATALGLSPLGFQLAKATQVMQSMRIEGATLSHSVCPYCAVGCALLAYTKKSASSEEGYFATKVMRGLGIVYLEQQARV